ncbi:MAG: energy transducer TonB [Acidobacteriaceae bacterium]
MEIPSAAELSGGSRNASCIAVILILFCVIGAVGRAEAQEAVCNDGNGRFEARFPTGVSVLVGAGHSGGFATRMCDAILSWNHNRLAAVPAAPQVDIDVLGADLGLGVPVVAFQVRKADHDWQSTYLIYSLRKNPRLLKTITGGDFYRAVDADFNKRVAIWTTDAVAVNGFDGLTYADYDFAPTIVLSFDHGVLTDVSAHYQSQYDQQIAEVRRQLSAQALSIFRKSDGRLTFGSTPAAEWARLRQTKVKVLEIVWAYLYSGRPQQAWVELEKTWPPADAARVKTEILAARAKGIDSEVAAIASTKLPLQWHVSPFVYRYLKASSPDSNSKTELNYGVPGFGVKMETQPPEDKGASTYEMAADRAPVAILLWRPPPSPSEEVLARSQETVRLIIDEAGKVRSVKMVLPKKDPDLLNAAKNWKFIPALKDGRPVAYNLKLNVSPYL